jgi:small subunit ribosomal protein S16
VIEELGYYDPMVKETDARAVLNGERIDYWLSVGALPTESVKTLIKKYGRRGTHLEKQKLALERLKIRPEAPPPVPIPRPTTPDTPEPEPVEAVAASSEDAGQGESAPSEEPEAGTPAE